MKNWGKTKDVVLARQDLTLSEAKKIVELLKDDDVSVSISVTASHNSWDTMLKLNGVAEVMVTTSDSVYQLDFLYQNYKKDDEPFYMTNSEARAAYFCLVCDTMVDNFCDLAKNQARRLGRSGILKVLLSNQTVEVKITQRIE